MHKKLKATKSDKMDNIFQLLSDSVELQKKRIDQLSAAAGNTNNKEPSLPPNLQPLEPNLEKALNKLGDDDNDGIAVVNKDKLDNDDDSVEILSPKYKKERPIINKEEKKDDNDGFAVVNTWSRGNSHAGFPNGVFSNFEFRRKIHTFIDEVTSNDEIEESDKESLVLSFYDPALSDQVAPYLDSLLATRKTSTAIAKNLLWFIRCLKMRGEQ